ncbi:MAG: ABC-F family ATP-binding cassette domain-containing protein [Fusobacteriaceae bacterium]
MNIIEIKNLSKSFFTQKLYKNVELEINSGEKIALIGKNGVGKSTLIRMITGDENPDRGEVILAEDMKIAIFDQFGRIELDKKVQDLLDVPFENVIAMGKKMEEIGSKFGEDADLNEKLMVEYSNVSDKFESLGGYSYIHIQAEFIDIFELGDKLQKKFRELSGGERQYIRLAMTLFSSANLIVLDEPLSFFDKKKTKWLSTYVTESNKAFLIISHNVDFIRNVANRIFDIDNYSVTAYTCDYNQFLREKKVKIKEEKKVDMLAQIIVDKTQKAMNKKETLLDMCDNKHAQAVILRRMERELQKLDGERVEFSPEDKHSYSEAPRSSIFGKRETGNDIVTLIDVTKEYSDKSLYKGVNFHVSKNEKIAIVGENGSGKSTLLRILTGKEKVTSGEVILNGNAKIAFIDQEIIFKNENFTTIEYLKEKTGLPEDFVEKAVDTLYNDEEEFRDKRVFMLSGGERKRLEIFANILAETDLLIIDEPTTYMDNYSRKVIVNMLLDYPGAVILVSHDKNLLKELNFITYDIRDKRVRQKITEA